MNVRLEQGTEYNGDIISLSLNPSSVLSKLRIRLKRKNERRREGGKRNTKGDEREIDADNILERVISRACSINRIRSTTDSRLSMWKTSNEDLNDPWRAWNRIESRLIDRQYYCSASVRVCEYACTIVFLLCVLRAANMRPLGNNSVKNGREREREEKGKRKSVDGVKGSVATFFF